MSAEQPRFDPYYKWLGIPKREQPPNHYRLLGIARFESDPAAIEAAAERRTSIVREGGKKKFPELAEKLIEQIAAARACLLDEQTRAAYDEELKEQEPKAPVHGPRKTRYDALQVSEVDTLLADAPLPKLPASAARDDERAQEDPLLELAKASHSIAPQHNDAARRHASAASARQSTPQAPIPPVVEKARDEADSDMRLVIKLAAGGCIIAGALTYSLLTWMSWKNSQTPGGQSLVASPVEDEVEGQTDAGEEQPADVPAEEAVGVPSEPSDAGAPADDVADPHPQ